ncbi:MAG: LD-carboxypeptidase, partial [Allomuricauda sp.]
TGSASGKLVGDSLSLILVLVGTHHKTNFTDAIVCIEDVEEAPYRMDRMLTQLIEGSTFKKAKGIVFGVCAGCDRDPSPNGFTLKEVLMDRIAPLNIPAAYGMSFGHVPNNFTFPIGIHAHWDADEMTLELLENAAL